MKYMDVVGQIFFGKNKINPIWHVMLCIRVTLPTGIELNWFSTWESQWIGIWHLEFVDLYRLVNFKFQIGDLLELNCTSEPSHPPSDLTWEMNKVPVAKDNYIFKETVHNGKKLHVTRIGLRIRLNRDHFHWGKLKVLFRVNPTIHLCNVHTRWPK